MIGEGSAKISEIITSPGEGVSPIRNSKLSDCEPERLPELSSILFEEMCMNFHFEGVKPMIGVPKKDYLDPERHAFITKEGWIS